MPDGELTHTSSDAGTFTFQARDADGIYRVEAWYQAPDHSSRYFGTTVADCPASFTITLPKQRKLGGRVATLQEVIVLDCGHRVTGVHGKTVFSVDGAGRVERTRTTQVTFDAQKVHEGLTGTVERLDQSEKRQRQILALLLILLLLTLWAGLGPLFL